MPSYNTYCLTWFSLNWAWGISLSLLQQSAAAAPYLGWWVSPHCCPFWPWTWNRFSRPSCTCAPTAPHRSHKRRIYTWTSLDGQHWNQIDYILCSQRWKSSIQSAKTIPGANCGSDHELLIAKFRLKLKKVGKITRPFRYDLNEIPYDYTVEVTNRFKGFDRVPEELWTEVCNIVQEAAINTISKKWNAKRQNGCLRRPYK